MELISRLQPKQIEAASYWLDNVTEELLYGGAKYGAKTYLGCNLIFSDALTYPGTHYFIARHTLNDLTKHNTPSIYEVFSHWGIDHRDYMRFNGKDNYFHLYNDSRVYYIDCKHMPSDPDFHRFGSQQYTRGWIEEVGEIPSAAIRNLILTVGRWKNKEYDLKRKVLLTCNPNKGFVYREFYLPFSEGKLPTFRKYVPALPTDNKYVPKDYMDALRRLPKAERARLLFGDWRYDDDPLKLVEYDKIIDLWSNDHIQSGQKYMTVDVARYGKDRTVIMIWDGMILIAIKVIPRSDLTHVRDVIKSMKTKHGVPSSNIYIDESGLGAGVVDMIDGSHGFVANRKPIITSSKENYDMLKSQCGFRLADAINDAGMFIRVEDFKDIIIEEVEQLKMKKEDTDQKWGLIPKEEMKERLGRSPDFLDCLIIRMYVDIADIDYFA